MSGVTSDVAAIWLSTVTAGVNLLFTVIGLYLVERVGRRPLTLGSLIGKTARIGFFVYVTEYIKHRFRVIVINSLHAAGYPHHEQQEVPHWGTYRILS